MNSEVQKKINNGRGRLSLLKRILLGLFFLLLSLLSFSSFLNTEIDKLPITTDIMKGATEYLNQTTKHTLEIFAVLRSLNAAISTLKDSRENANVDVEPGGLGASGGGSIAAGEVLQPDEDLIEQASTVMFVSSISLGTQRVLIDMGNWLGLTIFLGISLILMCVGLFLPRIVHIDFMRLGLNILIFSFIIKYGFPLTLCTVKIVSDKFLTSQYQHSFCMLQEVKSDINVSNQVDKKEHKGIIASIKRAFNKVKSKIETLKDMAFKTADYLISLVIVISVQSVVLPLLFFYFLIKLVKILALRARL